MDQDGDSYGSPGDSSCTGGGLPDCDDFDPSVHPAALELHDGRDNDCNGIVDDGFGSDQNGGATETILISFVSNSTWDVFPNDPSLPDSGPYLGPAQHVCLAPTIPPSCPPDAVIYRDSSVGWSADLSDIPSAHWIWAPGIDRNTSPNYPAQYFFRRAFEFYCRPSAAVISIAADDFAEIRVNGAVAGSSGSVTDVGAARVAQSYLRSFDISPFVVTGENRITVLAMNGPFGGGTTYEANPAGVVFGGSFTVETSPEACNGLDDDCDGVVPADENDADGDGFRICENDCDDADASVSPEAAELPGNTIDENCDGSLGDCDPNADWRSHGQFVRCVAQEVERLVEGGVISEDAGDDLINSAAQSSVGKK